MDAAMVTACAMSSGTLSADYALTAGTGSMTRARRHEHATQFAWMEMYSLSSDFFSYGVSISAF
jgi:hypothetical protein